MSPPVEHLVLIKVKDNTDPSKIESMVKGLEALRSIEQVIYLATGSIHRDLSPPPTINFTHFLHIRYCTKEDIDIYMAHPAHKRLDDLIFPICDHMMGVDWVPHDLDQPTLYPSPGSAIRVCFFKLKEGFRENERGEVLKAIGGLSKDEFGWLFHSFGENFSRFSKGFSIASMVVFPGLNELEALDSKEEFVKQQMEKVGGYLESSVVVDYIVSPPEST